MNEPQEEQPDTTKFASQYGDTSPSAAAVQTAALRKLTGEQRLEIAVEMSLLARELSRTRIRQSHPQWTEDEINRELLRYAFSSSPLPLPLR